MVFPLSCEVTAGSGGLAKRQLTQPHSKGASRRVICVITCLFMFSAALAVAQTFEGTRGTPDYQNVGYTVEPPISGVSGMIAPGQTTLVGGSLRPGNAPAPGVGEMVMQRSGFGAPFATQFLATPDTGVGGEMEPPIGVQISGGIPTAPANFDTTRAFFVGHAGKLFAKRAGFTEVEWNLQAGGTTTVQYLISAVPVHTPMAIYHTNGLAPSTQQTGAPLISVSQAGSVIVHHTPQIPEGMNGATLDDDFIWVDSVQDVLRARVAEGRVVLEFNTTDLPTTPGHFIGVQVIELRKYEPDSLVAHPQKIVEKHIGNQLLPTKSIPAQYLGTPEVTRGIEGGNNDFIYQHTLQGAVQEGTVWAIKETTNVLFLDAEVFWMRTSDAPGIAALDVDWPYEMARFAFTWPEDPAMAPGTAEAQLYVRGTSPVLGPSVAIDASLGLNADLMPFQESILGEGGGTAGLSPNGQSFTATGPCWSLLRYRPGNPVGIDGVGFQVVRSVDHTDTNFYNLALNPWDIGDEIVDGYHQEPAFKPNLPGYIHVQFGPSGSPRDDQYDKQIYDGDNGFDPPVQPTGQIFPVNTGRMEVWWYNVDGNGIAWPSLVRRYNCVWPSAPDGQIVVASQNGSGPIDPLTHYNWSIYAQNTPGLAGFNPNDEHAIALPPAGSNKSEEKGDDVTKAAFALRSDLGAASTSLPYVLVKFQSGPNPADPWDFEVYPVVTETAQYPLQYFGDAGLIIQTPYPLRLPSYTYWPNTEPISGPYWRDRDETLWAWAAGNNGGPANIVFRIWYTVPGDVPANQRFWIPGQGEQAPGTNLPWLDRVSAPIGQPEDVVYTVSWPVAPQMQYADVLVESKDGFNGIGLPSIDGQESVEILYQQAEQPGAPVSGESAKLIDYRRAREVPLAELPGELDDPARTFDDPISGLTIFSELSPGLRERIRYNKLQGTLRISGEFVEPPLGEAYVLLNVLTPDERDEMKALCDGQDCGAFDAAVDALYAAANDVIEVPASSLEFAGLALTTGLATAPGYVTLAFNNNDELTTPVSLEIIEVIEDLHAGEVAVIEPDCVFDERLLLKHKGDFAGMPDDYVFQWKYWPDEDGTPPINPDDFLLYGPEFTNGARGVNALLIEGPGLFTLSDNWFICRYAPYPGQGNTPAPGDWSDWTPAQLAEGWIKRVLNGITPFEQRFDNYALAEVNTIVDMIAQAGPRWEGSIPLNCSAANLNSIGLIEAYETVLNRGIDLSIGGLPPIDYPPANNALLLAAGRLADLYMLLGNEAFADATDPTIAYGTDDGTYGQEATSIHCFMNQTDSLITEELSLLRGRDDTLQPPVSTPPVYNRLVWNFTNDINGGEVAYALNYNIQDSVGNADGAISEEDAKELYPQGHGDAWGHYLTAIKRYYTLLRHPFYSWEPRAEAVLVGGVPVTVDYLDERKFARAAVAKAQTGAEVTGLTYRNQFVADPEGQWQGYYDNDPMRAWGVSEWGSRAGTGALFDWVVGNAILPSTDRTLTDGNPNNDHEGIQRIDRSTVTELREIPRHFEEIQQNLDKADKGLNPLGLAKNVVPFDIAPAGIDAGKTHFEQIYERAVGAMNNAIATFNHANNATQLLRRQSDSVNEFQQFVSDKEFDFESRLLEVFGYPYADDIGPTGTYPQDYNGPDLYHYMYVDPNEVVGEPSGPIQTHVVEFCETEIDAQGGLSQDCRNVTFHVSSAGFGMVKPPNWSGTRRAQGELQFARTDLVQQRIRLDQAMAEYDNLLATIDDRVALLEAQYDLNATELNILNDAKDQQKTLNEEIRDARLRQIGYSAGAQAAIIIANAGAEALPTVVGLANDATSAGRSAIRMAAALAAEALNASAQAASAADMEHQQAKELVGLQTQIRLTTARQEFAVLQQVAQLEQLVRNEITQRLQVYTQQEAVQQAAQRYLAVLAEGQRLLEERIRFRQRTASEIQDYRYKDMAFRIFRNEALQKYRAQLDLAARYVYLTAKAYDYETNLLGTDTLAGQQFLTDIVKARSLGLIQNGVPLTGGFDPGLSDPMARMSFNFTTTLQGQLGFNNPQTETNRFSLRSELFRIQPGAGSSEGWRDTLQGYVVENILDLPEFQRYCVPFTPTQAVEPGIVIPFSTNINFGLNFFGWPLGGGDSAYDSTNFATKIRSVGVWFTNYNNLGSGMSNTPRVYLVPVGNDVMRSPSGNAGETREWTLVDQKLPTPFPIGAGDLGEPDWIPLNDTLDNFAEIRRFGSLRAYHDSGSFDPAQTVNNSRLIGRSVWNTRWLLIIPAGTLNADRNEGILRFIFGPEIGGNRTGEGVSDIKIFFQTYAYSGGKKDAKQAAQ